MKASQMGLVPNYKSHEKTCFSPLLSAMWGLQRGVSSLQPFSPELDHDGVLLLDFPSLDMGGVTSVV